MDVQSTREPEPVAEECDNGPGTANEVKDSTEPMDTIENGETKDNKNNNSEEGRENGDDGNDNEKEVKKEEKKESGDLFKMIVVNSYGSQEVQQLEDNDKKKLRLTS